MNIGIKASMFSLISIFNFHEHGFIWRIWSDDVGEHVLEFTSTVRFIKSHNPTQIRRIFNQYAKTKFLHNNYFPFQS